MYVAVTLAKQTEKKERRLLKPPKHSSDDN
jgi:hypothetical protein